MARMNWEKARRTDSARQAERDAPPKKRQSTAFRLNHAARCAKCNADMPVNTPARYTADDTIVHATGCSSPARDAGPTKKRPVRARGKTQPSKSKRRAQLTKLSSPTRCGTCSAMMAAGTKAIRNKAGKLVHPNGCPKKARNDRESPAEDRNE
jgi:hypothetical protein